MDLAALADPDDSEEQRARLRATADRDASILAAVANDGPAVFPSRADLAAGDAGPAEAPSPIAPSEPIAPAPIVTYRVSPDLTTLPLRYAFDLDGMAVVAVSMLPPTFADVEAVTAGQISEIEMHARMCGLPVSALRAMRWPDIEAVTAMARHLAPLLARP